MRDLGINAIRVYHTPPAWFLEAACDQAGLLLLVDVPWSKHLCFLESRTARAEARAAVESAVRRGRDRAGQIIYSIGNEVPPDVVRWHGSRRVERFLGELADVAHQAGPGSLVTYANYPPTEYLEIPQLDFATFNVYLHESETFRRYLLRLQNLIGDKPLVLGELGMDTLRHGELAQAEFLGGHLREATLAGLAGTFVFSWTDDWHTGGQAVQDWAFGITHADRLPRPACHELRDIWNRAPYELLPSPPAVSVVVCSYNGGRTLAQCLQSLMRLEYPDYEIILIDDGSTDNTAEIAARFPDVRTIRQANQGLSAARNVGLHAARGSIVAYVDSDAYADPHWLAHLVAQLERSGADAVGGPNLAPEDGRISACVAAAPGQPMHVLESDQVAEHIPGCNMAFRREALQAINGFDPQFLKAGDDVDVCWRLQQAGYWITFAPGAFVWHHRRQSPRAYLRQQAGYGEAEALLRFKHPDRYNGRGQGKWRGVLYGPSLQGLVVGQPIIYHGTFGTGLFQTIYQPGPAHWAMVPSTLEWHLAALAFLLLGIGWWSLALVGGVMLLTSAVVAALQAAQARLRPEHDSLGSRLLIGALCWAQPLVRSWVRYRTRYFGHRAPVVSEVTATTAPPRTRLERGAAAYWGENRPERTELLNRVVARLAAHGCGKTIDTGWTNADLEVFHDPWKIVKICTAQEEHGGGKRLIRVRYRHRLGGLTKAMALLGMIAAFVGLNVGLPVALVCLALVAVGLAAARWSGRRLLQRLASIVDELALEMGLTRCHTQSVDVPQRSEQPLSAVAECEAV
jgi:GT2 family glycosyltransferase